MGDKLLETITRPISWVIYRLTHSASELLGFTSNVCTNIFIIQIEYTAQRNTVLKPLYLSQSKPWCNDSGVLNLNHGYYTTIMTPRRLSRLNPVSRDTNQPIRKWEFVQCMKVE